MEDRTAPGLFLEMSDLAPSAYADARVDALLSRAHVERASWWANAVPHRRDLPRRLPECAALGVYEVGAGFSPPPAPDDIRAFHFRRTPRPGQGCLCGEPTIGLSLVLISPRHPERAQDLRDWGDFVHIRHIAEVSVPGYGMVTPYENATRGEPRFLHLYEMHTGDPESAFRAMTPRVCERIGGPGTPAYERWARHEELVIDYVNTFRRVGERP